MGNRNVCVFKSHIFYLIMASKHRNSDASNFDMPERSSKVLPLNGKVRCLNLIRKEKKFIC